MHYKLLNRRGAPEIQGHTINMSGTGLLFAARSRLRTGDRIEIYVLWPPPSGEGHGFTLLMYGRVVRSDHDKAAVDIEKFEV